MDRAPFRKKIGGKVYEKWMIVGKGNSKQQLSKMMERRRHGGRASVRMIKSRGTADITSRIYVRRK